MRNKIWEKDDFFMIGGKRIDMDPSVVELPTEPIPLVWQYDFGRIPPHGLVFDIRLEDEEITGEPTFYKEEDAWHLYDFFDDGLIRFGGFYNKVVKNDAGTWVTTCKLDAVSINLMATMPGAKL